MGIKQTTPATALAVTLAEAKANLRIEAGDTSLDAMVTAWIKGITAHAEHHCGRAIMSQTWLTTLDAFPEAIAIPRPPYLTGVSLQYFNTNNQTNTLVPTTDYVIDDSDSCLQYVRPAVGKAWPASYDRFDAVRLTTTCGYSGTDGGAPEGIKTYLLAKLVEQFDPNAASGETVQSSFIDRLLDPYRIEGF